MQDSEMVDRLAEWCRLSERGWRRDPESGVLCEPEWVRDVPGGVKVWRPLDSDDDCRVVMEECRERGMLLNVACAMEPPWREAPDDNSVFMAWLLLASPREKCKAVLWVLGDA